MAMYMILILQTKLTLTDAISFIGCMGLLTILIVLIDILFIKTYNGDEHDF